MGVALGCFASYWPSLHGPLFLDDLATLSPLQDWLEQRIPASSLVFGNHTGPLGRPIAMASFLLNGAIFGDSVFWLKTVNWLIHLLNSGLLWLLLRKLQGVSHQPVSKHLPLVVAVVWLLLPIHVSTVAYVVQRMALLCATFVLTALISFAEGLRAFSLGHLNRGRFLVFILTPALTLAAALTKENGLLVPLLCLPVAWLWRQSAPHGRPEPALFFALFLGIPLVAVTSIALTEPAKLGLNGYLIRDFSMTERLLTQPRVLLDYATSVFLPSNRTVSPFTDAYEISRGVFDPLSTALALLFWGLMVIATVFVSRRRPIIAAGVAFFLLGHSMESSFLSLEIYFAHRNYLPSAGIVLAASDAVAWALSRSKTSSGLTPWLLLGGLLLMECVITVRFAYVFSSMEAMAISGRMAHPQSSRAALALSAIAMESGNHQAALDELDRLASVDNRESRQVGSIAYLATACQAGLSPAHEKWLRANRSATTTITRHVASAFQLLFRSIQQANCGENFRISAAQLAETFINASNQPETVTTRQQLRLIAGNLFVDVNLTDKGLEQLETAFDAGGSGVDVGVSLVASLLAAHRVEDAKTRLLELRRRTSSQDSNTNDFINRADAMIRTLEAEGAEH
ncbi:MAG TPA: hypothetical protein PLX09_07380 [Xanthomonadaceae bacterium]|nr:hypothetical protein [Xanthomonadaceae bacterium]